VPTEEGKKQQAEAVAAANRRRMGEKRPNQKSTHTPESDAKRSEAMKRRWADPEYKARLSAKFKASMTPETRTKHSKAQKRVRSSETDKARRAEIEARPETKAARSAAARKRWARPGEHERQSEAIRQTWVTPTPERLNSLHWRHDKPLTGLEIQVLAALAARGVTLPAEHIHMTVGRYEFDFYVESLNLDVECDSRHWHAHPDRVKHDAVRDKKLKALGYTVLRITEEEITAGDFTRLDEILSK